MMNEECPNCRQLTNTSFSRLVKDSCGHSKCRMCLLYEEQGCKACHDEHRIRTIESFDCLSSSNQVLENTCTNPESSLVMEETILPLELVINKNLKSTVTDLEFISNEPTINLELQHEDNVSFTDKTKDIYKSAISNGNLDNSSRSHISELQPYNLIPNICTHSHELSSSLQRSPKTYIALETKVDTKDMKMKLDFTDKTNRLKKKNSKYSDRSHILVVPGTPERYKCNICGKVFRNKKSKCYHDACITGIRPYQCSFCDRSFVKRSHFEYHERVHSGYKPYKCNLCNKAFPQQNKLTRHMYSHSEEKVFVCPKCNKRYTKRDDLKNHLNMHSSTAVYACKACEKSFRLLTNLKRHMLTHSNERPHICDQCNKSFKEKSLLIRHKRTHGKERPFSCAHCNRVFLSKSELRRHLTVHSDDKPFSCEFCQTVFRRKDNLNRHIRHHHSDDSTFEEHKSQNDVGNSKKKGFKSKRVNNLKQKQKSKKVQKHAYNAVPRSPNKISVGYVNSSEQINSRLDSMGNITPVIKNITELSNAVPVINGPISIKHPEDKTENRKKIFTYTEPIPRAEAVNINRRIEEKLYSQNISNHNYFFRHSLHRINKQLSASHQSTRPNPCTKSNSFDQIISPQNTALESIASSKINMPCEEINPITYKANEVYEKQSLNCKNKNLHDLNIIEKVININNCNDVNSKEENLTTSTITQKQANCVSTITKFTIDHTELVSCNNVSIESNDLHSVNNYPLSEINKTANNKTHNNVHWRRRITETLKPSNQ